MAAYSHDANDVTTQLLAADATKCTQSGEYSSTYAGWKAFNHDGGWGFWSNTAGVKTGWLKWDLGAGRKASLTSYTVTSRGDGYPTSCPVSMHLSGSNDDSSWDELDSQYGLSWGIAEMKTFTFGSATAEYRYWKIDAVASEFAVAIGEVELIGDLIQYAEPSNYLCSRGIDRMRSKGISLGPKVPTDRSPSFLIMRRNRLRTTGVSLEDAMTYNYQYACKIPDMTSNTAPAGVCSSSVGTAWNAYDRNSATFVQNNATLWVQYRFPMLVKADQLEFITHAAGDNDIKNWKLECSTDEVNWTVAASGQKANGDKNLQTITSFNAHNGSDYWRFTIIDSWQTWFTVLTIQIIGKTNDVAYEDFGY